MLSETPGGRWHSSVTCFPFRLRPKTRDRLTPNLQVSRGYVSDSGLHPSPRCTRLSDPVALAPGHYTTERLTKPYSRGPVRIRAPSLSTGNHCQVAPSFQVPGLHPIREILPTKGFQVEQFMILDRILDRFDRYAFYDMTGFVYLFIIDLKGHFEGFL